MPGSSVAAVQSPGPVLQTSSRRQTSLCSRQVQCCRSRADDLEMREREKEHMKAQTCLGAREREGGHEGSTATSRRCTAAATQGKLKEGAHRRPQTKSRQNSETWDRPRANKRDKSHQNTCREVACDSNKKSSCGGVRNAQLLKQKISVREGRRQRETRVSMTAQRCWTSQRITPWPEAAMKTLTERGGHSPEQHTVVLGDHRRTAATTNLPNQTE